MSLPNIYFSLLTFFFINDIQTISVYILIYIVCKQIYVHGVNIRRGIIGTPIPMCVYAGCGPKRKLVYMQTETDIQVYMCVCVYTYTCVGGWIMDERGDRVEQWAAGVYVYVVLRCCRSLSLPGNNSSSRAGCFYFLIAHAFQSVSQSVSSSGWTNSQTRAMIGNELRYTRGKKKTHTRKSNLFQARENTRISKGKKKFR